jgi:hypothetical protein
MDNVVYVVMCTDTGYGVIAGVFSSLDKASDYVGSCGYSSFIITEHMVDSSSQRVVSVFRQSIVANTGS